MQIAKLNSKSNIAPVETAVHHHARRGGLLDIRFGLSLLFSRSVKFRRKAAGLAIGLLVTGLVIALELPLESIVGGLLNLIGVGLDALLDGFEAMVCPILVAAMFMPKLTLRDRQIIVEPSTEA